MVRLVRSEIADGVAVVTLDRPERLNAFADDMREQLAEALEAAGARADVRVLVLTGAGRAFCAGGDVKHMVALKEREESFEALRALLEAGRRVVGTLASLPFPTVAAVNGPAAGAGMNLALACDLRVAADGATFTESFVKIALHADWGGSYFLPRAVGTSRALELCWLGEPVDAAEALRIGLVSHVWPAAEFEREWRALAARLAAAPVTSVRLAKETLRASASRSLDECFEAETDAQRRCWASPDSAEGLRAFVEKRAPVFGGGAVTAGSEVREPLATAHRFE
jgi:2-(1,2-epoxy-1,2-dihydrophenyl)acetyl-CoA isomerase